MNKFPRQTTNEYDNKSSSNPSLITAGLPSGSIMTSRIIQPSSTTKHNYYLNQNRATDTQPISLDSPKSDDSQSITLSHGSTSDTYLNLSRKDIDDLMGALQTLVQCVQNDMGNNNPVLINDNESRLLTVAHDKNSVETNSPSHYHRYYPRYSIRNRHRSLSSDGWRDDHDAMDRTYFPPVNELYDMKRRQERRILRQLQCYQNYFHRPNLSSHPSYSSNAILHASTYGSNIRPKQTYHHSRQHQPAKRLPSSTSLSSHIFDQLIYIDQNQSPTNIQMLPGQAHTLQILQNSRLHSLISVDSLNTKSILRAVLKPYRLQKGNSTQTSETKTQLNLNKTDVATQWSLQIVTPKSNSPSTAQEQLKLSIPHTNSTVLTKLSQSRTTIATNNSAVNTSLTLKVQPLVKDHCRIHAIMDTNEMDFERSSSYRNDEQNLAKSETERFLTSLNLPTCKCSNAKLRTGNINAKHFSMDDTITCISFNDEDDDVSSTSVNMKKVKETSIKCAAKRTRHHPSKVSRTHQSTKRSRRRSHSQSTSRLMTIIQSLKTSDLQEDSSFNFFDTDTTFSDVHDRFFSDTNSLEK